jgi:vacuolar-type H+-ATPase subunit H
VRLFLDSARTSGGREVDAVADEKAPEQESLEHIKFYQDVIKKESADSPLFMIREKELEISGRVLSAKKKVEQIVADARKKSSETLAQAGADGEKEARAVETRLIRDAEDEAAQILANVDSEVADVRARTADRGARAVEVIVEAVTRL